MANKGVTIPVHLDLDIKDATKSADEMGRKIEDALKRHSGTEDPQIAQIMKSLEALQEKIQATVKFKDDLTKGSANYQDLTKIAEQWSITERNTRAALNEYKEYLRSIGKSRLVENFENRGSANIDRAYFGKNRTAEITEQIEKLKQLQASWANASREKEKYLGMAWNAAPNQLTDKEEQAIARNFKTASDSAEVFLLKLNQLEGASNKLNKSSNNLGFRRNFYIVRTLVNDISKGINNLMGKFKQLSSHIGDVVKKMLHLNKESRKTTHSLNDGFKTALRNILRYGFGIRSLFFLFRRLRKYAKEALDEMSKQIPQVNAQMSKAAQSLNQMKGALATAIQPLLNVIIPLLQKIASLVTSIMNTIGGIIALFTGQSVIYKATATQVDYAASLDKTGKSAKKAKKELEGYLSPIDEINKYQSKKDDEDDSGSGGGGASPLYTYAAQPISDLAKKIKDILDRLLAPVKEAWEKMGDFVKKSWKYALDEMLKLGQSVARDFWKMWEEPRTEKIFENIFETIGWIGQAVGNLAKQFREAWDYNDTGLKILQNVRDIVLIITEHIRNMARATADWAAKLDFKPLLTAIEKWLESLKPAIDALSGVFEDFYTMVILPLAKWATEKGGPQLIQVFTDFNNKVRWYELRQKLVDLWKSLEPFAERVGEGLILFIQDVSNALANFINSKTFQNFLDKIKDWMDNVDAEDVARTLKLVAGAIITLKAALFALEGIKALNTTTTAIKTFLSLFGAGGAGAAAGAGVAGAGSTAAAISETATATTELAVGLGALRTKLSLFENAAFDGGATAAFFDGIKRINEQGDIYKLSDDLQKGKISLNEYKKAADEITWGNIEQTGYTWKKFWGDFFNPFDDTNMGQALTQLFKMLKDETHTYKGELKTLTAEYAQGTLTTSEYHKKLEELRKKYGETANSSKSTASIVKAGAANIATAAEDMGKRTTTSLTNIKAGAANMTSSVQKNNKDLNTSYNNFGTNTSKVTKNVTTAITNSSNEIEGVEHHLQKTIDDDSTKISNSVSNMSDSIVKDTDTAKTEFNNSMDSMSESVTTNAAVVTEKTDTIKASFTKEQWTFSGVAEGLGETFRGAVNAVGDVWNDLADSLNGTHSVAGKEFTISLPKIPRLAQGAVIPPNKEFMAVLGDQKSGTNIETPLSTMVEAFNQALRQSDVGGVKQINFMLPDRRTLASYTIAGGRIIQTSTGKNPFELA